MIIDMNDHLETKNFFQGHEKLWPLYQSFEKQLLQRFPDTQIEVRKTQISYYSRHLFACVSFLRMKRRPDQIRTYFVLTLGLPFREQTTRDVLAVEPYPGRWTTHVPIAQEADLNAELFAWLDQAYEFSMRRK
jgi:hypothetical protein